MDLVVRVDDSHWSIVDDASRKSNYEFTYWPTNLFELEAPFCWWKTFLIALLGQFHEQHSSQANSVQLMIISKLYLPLFATKLRNIVCLRNNNLRMPECRVHAFPSSIQRILNIYNIYDFVLQREMHIVAFDW